MINKNILTIVILLSVMISGIASAQEDDLLDVSLPAISPTSPESASLGRYGMIPNESPTGQMNYSVPIYSLPLKNGSWNVSLGYNYGGFLLEGKPSMTGLGWTLLATGVVNREIRDLADESEFGYYGVNHKRDYITDYITNGDMPMEAFRLFSNGGTWDSEPDVYRVSVAGLNFSFKLDTNGDPVYLSKHAHHVFITWDTGHYRIASFKIVDVNGVVYTFDVKERTVPEGDEHDQSLYTDVSWLLSKVEYPNEESIYFSYNANTHISYDFSAQGAATTDPNNCENPLDCIGKTYSGYYNDAMTRSVVERQVLGGINFPSGGIVFHTPKNGDKVIYDGISIYDKHNNKIENYNFTYSGTRDLLTSITRNDGEFYYEFEYYGIYSQDLPGFFNTKHTKPLSKDQWGYYNGSANQYALNVPSSDYNANLTPDFGSTQAGALKKIIYPTKGVSIINYEQNDIAVDFESSDYYADVELQNKTSKLILRGDGIQGTGPHKEVEMTFTFQYPTVGILTHFIEGVRYQNHIRMSIVKEEVCPDGDNINGPISSQYDIAAQQIREGLEELNNPSISTIPIFCPELYVSYGPDDVADGDDSRNMISSGSGGRIVFLPGTYTFKISTETNYLNNFNAEIQLQLQKGWNNTDPIALPLFANKKVGGIRVASIQDCPNGNSTEGCVQRNYTYSDANNISSGILNVTPTTHRIYTRKYYFSDQTRDYSINFNTYSTGYYSALNPSFGTPVYYDKITETFVGDDDLGYTVRNYETEIRGSAQHPKIPVGENLTKDNVVSVEQYAFVGNNNYEVVQSTENQYFSFSGLLDPTTKQDMNPKHPWGLKIDRTLNAILDFRSFSFPLVPTTPTEEAAVKSLYDISTYKELNAEGKIKKSVQRQVLKDKELHTQQSFVYNTENYQVNSTRTVGNNGEIIESRITYPTDISNPTPAEVKLQGANRLSVPLKTELYRINGENEDLLSTSYVQYKKWEHNTTGGTVTITSPEKIQTAKGMISNLNPLEDRVVYHAYDAKGNPLEVSKVGGAHIVYIWGYQNTYPIAKIEKATYAEVESYVSNLQMLSNADNDRTKNFVGNEGALRQGLDNLRTALSNAMVTTYTYDPLIGVTSMTDPRGYTTYYDYDDLNRVSHISDTDTNITDKYYYNYKEKYGIIATELTVDQEHIVKGASPYIRVTVSNGSGDYSYDWKINDQSVSNAVGTLSYTFSATGTFTVSCTVKDNLSNHPAVTKTKTVQVYNPLAPPTLSYSPLKYRDGTIGHFITGRTITFTATNLAGGSGSKQYEWYINNTKQSATGTTFSKTFSTKGTYAVKFKVIDSKISNHFMERTAAITIHNLVTTGAVISDSSNYTVQNGASLWFGIQNVAGGSGSYQYEWYLNSTSGNPVATTTTSNFDYRVATTVSGYHTIYCSVKDLTSGYLAPYKSKRVYITIQRDTGGGSGGGSGDGRPKDPVGGDQ